MMLMTKDLASKLTKAHAESEKTGGERDPMVWGKFFNPTGAGTWYLIEFDGSDTLFTYVTGLYEDELGYSSLAEMMAYRGRFGLGIERDMHFTPKRLSEIKASIEARGVA